MPNEPNPYISGIITDPIVPVPEHPLDPQQTVTLLRDLMYHQKRGIYQIKIWSKEIAEIARVNGEITHTPITKWED